MPHALHLRIRSLMATLLLALAAVAVPVRAVEVPESVVTPDTMLVVWVDADAVDQFCRGMNSLLPDMADDKKAKALAVLQLVVKGQQQFKAWGGEGFLLVADRDAFTDKAHPGTSDCFLLKAEAGADPAVLEKELHEMAAEAKDPEWKKVMESIQIKKFGTDGPWYAVTLKTEVASPRNGTAKDAAVFNAALKRIEKSPLQLCFRMLPSMKAQVRAKLDAEAKNPNGGGNAAVDLASGLLEPLTKLDGVLVSGDLAKDAERMDIVMHFDDAASAAEFTASCNGLIQIGKGMVAMQMSKWAKYGVDIQNANAIMDQCTFKVDQSDAQIKLDSAVFARCAALIRQLQIAQAKMKSIPPLSPRTSP